MLQATETSHQPREARSYPTPKAPASEKTNNPTPVVVQADLSKCASRLKDDLYYVFQGEAHRAGINRLRQVRAARQGDHSLHRIISDCERASRRARKLAKQLDEHGATLPENEKVDYPTVRLGWRETGRVEETAFVDEIRRFFAYWINKQKADPIAVAHQQQRRAHLITELQSLNFAVRETQRMNGRWQLRLKFCAEDHTANRLRWEIVNYNPKTADECRLQLRYVAKLCLVAHRDPFEHRVDVFSEYQVAAICGRIGKRVASLSKN